MSIMNIAKSYLFYKKNKQKTQALLNQKINEAPAQLKSFCQSVWDDISYTTHLSPKNKQKILNALILGTEPNWYILSNVTMPEQFNATKSALTTAVIEEFVYLNFFCIKINTNPLILKSLARLKDKFAKTVEDCLNQERKPSENFTTHYRSFSDVHSEGSGDEYTSERPITNQLQQQLLKKPFNENRNNDRSNKNWKHKLIKNL